MGGHGSGRQGGRPTTEGSITLNISKLFRNGTIADLAQSSGSIVWENAEGERAYSVGFQASLDEEGGWLRLMYSKQAWGTPCRADYRIALATTSQPFGGRRWWFECPLTGQRVQKLYLPVGATVFASRRGYRLGYACQRGTPHDRAIQRAFKLRRKLGSAGGIGEPIWKPPRMRSKTFDREMAKVEAAEGICNVNLAAYLDQIQRKSARLR